MAEKRNIKEFNTTGMELWEREKLFKEVIPIPIGEIVYRSGDFASYTEVIKVDEENQKIVTMFWNSLYFDNESAADYVTRRAHAAYGRYQAEAANGAICCYGEEEEWYD